MNGNIVSESVSYLLPLYVRKQKFKSVFPKLIPHIWKPFIRCTQFIAFKDSSDNSFLRNTRTQLPTIAGCVSHSNSTAQAQHKHRYIYTAMYPNFCEHKTTTIRKYNLIIYNWTNDERNWVLFLRNQKAKVVCCLCCSLHFVCRSPTDWALPVLSVCSLSAHTWR